MRMMLKVTLPHEPFNAAVKSGKAGQTISKILEKTKPEAVYFTEDKGHRCGIFILNVERPSSVPALAEPWFLNFNADCEFHIVMSPQDLAESGLEKLGQEWK